MQWWPPRNFAFHTKTYFNVLLFLSMLNFRTIAYSVSKTRFFVGKPPFDPVSRELPITNTFSFTMVIYDAAFPAEMENIFSVSLSILLPLQRNIQNRQK